MEKTKGRADEDESAPHWRGRKKGEGGRVYGVDLFHVTHESPCVQKHDQKERDGDLPVGEGRTEPVRGEQRMALQVSTPQRAERSRSPHGKTCFVY